MASSSTQSPDPSTQEQPGTTESRPQQTLKVSDHNSKPPSSASSSLIMMSLFSQSYITSDMVATTLFNMRLITIVCSLIYFLSSLGYVISTHAHTHPHTTRGNFHSPNVTMQVVWWAFWLFVLSKWISNSVLYIQHPTLPEEETTRGIQLTPHRFLLQYTIQQVTFSGY